MAVSRLDIQGAPGRVMDYVGRGHLMGFPTNPGTFTAGTGVPTNGVQGYAPAANWYNFLGTVGSLFYLNIGTFTSAVWLELTSGAAAVGSQYQTNAATAGTTLTAANVSGGANLVGQEVYLNMTGTLAGGANAQLPTAAALVANIPTAYAGMSWYLQIINSSGGAFSWTVTTNTGWTLNGTMTVAQNTWRGFVVSLTNVASGSQAATLQSVGTGTYS